MVAEEKKSVQKEAKAKASAKKASAKPAKDKESKKTAAKKSATAKAAVKKTAKKTAVSPKVKDSAAKAKPAEVKAKATKRTASKSKAEVKADATEAALREMQARIEDSSEEEVEALKYGSETSQMPELYPAARMPGQRELDRVYGDTKLALLVRDPEWIFAYWEIGSDTRKLFGIPRDQHGKTMVMRWYDVTGLENFDGTNAVEVMDVQVNDIAISWYQKLPHADRSWCADLGIMDETGVFTPICRSRIVHTPRSAVAAPGQGEVWAKAEELRLQQIFEASGSRRIPASLGSEGVVSSERLVR